MRAHRRIRPHVPPNRTQARKHTRGKRCAAGWHARAPLAVQRDTPAATAALAVYPRVMPRVATSCTHRATAACKHARSEPHTAARATRVPSVVAAALPVHADRAVEHQRARHLQMKRRAAGLHERRARPHRDWREQVAVHVVVRRVWRVAAAPSVAATAVLVGAARRRPRAGTRCALDARGVAAAVSKDPTSARDDHGAYHE